MTWYGPELDPENRDLRELVKKYQLDHDVRPADSNTRQIGWLRDGLVRTGLWTMGAEERHGGGGASPESALVVIEQLARAWPALAWASVQTQAAVDVLGATAEVDWLVSRLHDGTAAVAVVDEDKQRSPLVQERPAVLRGTIDRIDPASAQPHVLVLRAQEDAVLVSPQGLHVHSLAERTGMGGACTMRCSIDTVEGQVWTLAGVDTAAVRARIRIGGAAVACGIASAALDVARIYSAAREQFGAPLNELPTVRSTLQHTAGQVSVLAHSLFGAAAGGRSLLQGLLAHGCEVAIDAAAMAVQAHGGYGYLTEYVPERLLRDAISMRAAASPWFMPGDLPDEYWR